ncbi:allantoinase PuuE [Marinomonas mediterranea]|jgi:putative urate catabolism protein|uniref:Urate catabolism protein n=1 Tax=Marinomonas mediterranea (strain ATCC 700492 / JCM 21426 / NBRC 103028 / MMB-1) TaxID=717774 RepID=F2JW68_MARM1|nr:allantoinase PuuE [Marinomonas mediterranea]ADZ89456.1 urate catabolism protein [Marinomonas mediterranea MMB-1]WCN07552.1 allantoinase PuuE [Marinomonas mediterranea]WCN15708.1 allantoinase PuuE [Marinomonas mediterranea MMB-1]
MKNYLERDYKGYGRNEAPQVEWPNGARIALQFVLNFEEGGENCVLHGDEHAETFLSDIFGAQPYKDRHMSMESLYEYGSRAGVWRILNEFEKRGLPLSIFAIATALQRNPEVAKAIVEGGHEVVCHGLKWIHYQDMPIEQEREHMREALALIEEVTGVKPIGWYTGRDSPNTRKLVSEQPQLQYDSDYYGDDLPFWTEVPHYEDQTKTKPHLIIPYTLDCNDMRFSSPYGFSHGTEFFDYLRDSFDCLYDEGASAPKMMSIGLHCRTVGKPSRFMGLKRFLDYVQSHEGVWITRRCDIAKHWMENHPPKR